MPEIQEVRTYLATQGIEVRQYELPTPTAELAAVAVGCRAAEIAKTLLFFVGGKPLVVVTCGDMKVKSSLLKQQTGSSGKVKLPQAADVKTLTGYAPGGVCPFMLPAELPIFLDRTLQRFALVYAAAGNDASAVPITAHELERLTAGTWVEVCEPRILSDSAGRSANSEV